MFRIFRWLPWAAPEAEETPIVVLTVTAVHAEYAQFVFRSLQQLGVRIDDLDDLRQEVFIVVHRKLHTFDRKGSMRAWLFGICKNVVGNHWKKKGRRPKITTAPVPETSTEGLQANPEERFAEEQARQALAEVLDELDMDKRAVFVMYEIDQLGCEEIAEVLDIPVGTVHSRLSTARKAFAEAVKRRQARLPKGAQR